MLTPAKVRWADLPVDKWGTREPKWNTSVDRSVYEAWVRPDARTLSGMVDEDETWRLLIQAKEKDMLANILRPIFDECVRTNWWKF